MHWELQETRLEELVSESELYVTASGTVDKTQKSDYGYMYFLKEVSVTYENSNYDADGILVYADEECDIGKGDYIVVTGNISKFDKAMNPGEFDMRLYYSTLNIDFGLEAEELIISRKSNNAIYSAAAFIRSRLQESYESIAGEDCGVYCAMILGDKSSLDENIYDLYQASGISHILAISGLHISLIGMCIYKLLRRLGCVFLPAAIIAGGTILFYGIITGNGISTTRAIIMFIVFLMADVIGRTYDILSAMSLAALLMMSRTPFLIYNSGFLLSYGAIIGIVLVGKALKNMYNGPKIKVVDALITSLSVQLVTFPIILSSFYQFPLYAVFLNIIIVPLMGSVMILGIAGGVVGCFSVPVGTFIIGLPHFILKLYEILCDFTLKLPNSVITPGKPETIQIVIYYLILAGIILISAKKVKNVYKYAGLPLLYVVMAVRIHNYLQIDVLYVGQGDGIFIETPEGLVITIDGGSTDESSLYEYTLEPYLKSQGITNIDYAIVTHCDADHISGITACLEADSGITIECLIMPDIGEKDDSYNNLVTLAEQVGCEVKYISVGDIISTDSVKLTCLHPTQNFICEDRNSYSTVMSLEYKDFSMLFTGDISSEEELTLVDSIYEHGDYDVLKVAHHGSSYSSCCEFLEAVSPDCAVISAGIDNSYGHPHEDTLLRLEDIKVDIRVTAEEGAVRFKIH